MRRLNQEELPETVKKLNGDSSDLLRETIKELKRAVKKAKEKKGGTKE